MIPENVTAVLRTIGNAAILTVAWFMILGGIFAKDFVVAGGGVVLMLLFYFVILPVRDRRDGMRNPDSGKHRKV